jgi:hypothetical protein
MLMRSPQHQLHLKKMMKLKHQNNMKEKFNPSQNKLQDGHLLLVNKLSNLNLGINEEPHKCL